MRKIEKASGKVLIFDVGVFGPDDDSGTQNRNDGSYMNIPDSMS